MEKNQTLYTPASHTHLAFAHEDGDARAKEMRGCCCVVRAVGSLRERRAEAQTPQTQKGQGFAPVAFVFVLSAHNWLGRPSVKLCSSPKAASSPLSHAARAGGGGSCPPCHFGGGGRTGVGCEPCGFVRAALGEPARSPRPHAQGCAAARQTSARRRGFVPLLQEHQRMGRACHAWRASVAHRPQS